MKSLISGYYSGPVDCAQGVKGEGLAVGKAVKSTHSDQGWLVFWFFFFFAREGQHCLKRGGHSHTCCSYDLDRALGLVC